jgi:hypothetical protein
MVALALPPSGSLRDRVARADSEKVAQVAACPGRNRRDDHDEPEVEVTLAGKNSCSGEHARTDDRNADP